MQRYIITRLLLTVPTLLGVSIVVFTLVRLIPGSVLDQIVGEYGATNEEVRGRVRRQLGLDRPIATQYVTWIGNVLQGDFGQSFYSRVSVGSELRARIPVTLELGAMALAFSVLISIPLGVISALQQDRLPDYILRGGSILLIAVPSFWLAVLLITFGSHYWGWAPPVHYYALTENPSQNLALMVPPALILGLGLSGSKIRLTRAQMLEVLRQDYVRTARAKGLRERAVIVRHALKNALIPVVTVIGLQIPVLVGGTVILETVFSIPGVGRYIVEGLNRRDFPVIQAVNLVVATVIVFSNLAVDLSYGLLDPRIRYR
jgi:peptide/nickel transport system permease protein